MGGLMDWRSNGCRRMDNGHDTLIFSSLIFTQYVSFLLLFTSARTHSLFGFMPLLLFPTRQFIPVALGQHLSRACHETSHFV
jgi:hypothetical protein